MRQSNISLSSVFSSNYWLHFTNWLNKQQFNARQKANLCIPFNKTNHTSKINQDRVLLGDLRWNMIESHPLYSSVYKEIIMTRKLYRDCRYGNNAYHMMCVCEQNLHGQQVMVLIILLEDHLHLVWCIWVLQIRNFFFGNKWVPSSVKRDGWWRIPWQRHLKRATIHAVIGTWLYISTNLHEPICMKSPTNWFVQILINNL